MKAKQSCIFPKLILKKLDRLTPYKEVLNCSSKLDSVIETILQNKDNGNGKLIFCQFREEIDEIAKRLRDGDMKNIVTMDGRTTNFKRKQILENKNDAIILQIQTGCEGLNLQEHYSEVYFVSPHWNPAVEDQAIARCHRIGQLKPVVVNRFEMSTFGIPDRDTVTIDKYVNVVQENKRNIANQYM
jgi:SNF2 family DNA or RNA helicase